MNLVDLIIILVGLVGFALCVRSMVRGAKSGECADCASSGSCNADKSGHCKESAKLMASAAAAAERYKAEKGA